MIHGAGEGNRAFVIIRHVANRMAFSFGVGEDGLCLEECGGSIGVFGK